jgi:hypothetical protein
MKTKPPTEQPGSERTSFRDPDRPSDCLFEDRRLELETRRSILRRLVARIGQERRFVLEASDK